MTALQATQGRRQAPLLRRKGTDVARRRTPPELRGRTWTEGSVWELLVAGDILLYRFSSPFADLGMTPRQRRELRREIELLKATHVAYILPHNGGTRRPPQPWLHVHTRRGGYYRVGDAGEIQRFGRRVQRLGAGSITEHRWYATSLREVRWLSLVAEGILQRKAREQNTPHTPSAAFIDPDPVDRPIAEQLPLFP